MAAFWIKRWRCLRHAIAKVRGPGCEGPGVCICGIRGRNRDHGQLAPEAQEALADGTGDGGSGGYR